MKNLVLALLLGVSVPSFAGTLEQLERIAEQASEYIGNGDSSTGRYVVSKFDKTKAIQALNKRKFEGCTWTTVTSRREAISLIKTEKDARNTAESLMKMYDQKRLKAVIGLLSDNDVSCSRYFVEVYTNDGYKLNLNFSNDD
jgi:hypothetical protein